MSDHSTIFLLVTILSLGTLLLVFGMKYFSAGRQARLFIAQDGAWRDVAERSMEAQKASAALLASMQADLAEMKGRVAAMEKMLREVG